MIHSLVELRNFFVQNDIEIKEFNGWSLKIGKDTWTLAHDVFYRNNEPTSAKEKSLIELYHKSIYKSKTRKWKGISTRKVVTPK